MITIERVNALTDKLQFTSMEMIEWECQHVCKHCPFYTTVFQGTQTFEDGSITLGACQVPPYNEDGHIYDSMLPGLFTPPDECPMLKEFEK